MKPSLSALKYLLPLLMQPSTEASLLPASSSPNITAVTETRSSLQGMRPPTPPLLHVDIHPEMGQQEAVSGWEEDATPPTPPPPTCPPPLLTPVSMPPVDHIAGTADDATAEDAANPTRADSTFEYSTLTATSETHSESTEDIQFVTPPHPPQSSPPPLTEVKVSLYCPNSTVTFTVSSIDGTDCK